MLSVNDMFSRLALLQEARKQGEDAIELCRIRVREMPLVTAGEDASECIPYALHPEVAGQLAQAVRRLRDHMQTYIIEGTTVSAHKLPQHTPVSSAMMQALRAAQPQLSTHLLHHWCADEQGAGALRRLLHTNWHKAWHSELPGGGDVARRLQWLGAVNILLLGLLRHEVQRQSEEHAEMLDGVMVHVLGTSFRLLADEFIATRMKDADAAQARTVYRRIMVPATALAFFRRQPKGRIFADAAHMVTAYGLESELLPRMRQACEEMKGSPALSILAELSSDPMADHLLKRSWARLCLRDMAAASGQGVWNRLASDSRKLDALLSSPEKTAAEMQSSLEPFEGQPFAGWLLSHTRKKGLFGKGGTEGEPWREDERLLQLFRLFEFDAAIETERRTAGERWLNRESVLVGAGRGSEAGRILVEAHGKGKIVLLHKDAEAPLFVAGGESAAQGALVVDWTEYLRIVERITGPGMERFLSHVFQPGVMELAKGLEGVFADSFSASGFVLRGSLAKLLLAGIALRRMLESWFDELDATAEQITREDAVVSMCIAQLGDWSVAKQPEAAPIGRLAFSQGMAQAKSAVSRNDGLRRLLLSFDARDGKRPPGGVRVESIRMADGKSIPILCNRGYALTGSALHALMASTTQLRFQAFRSPADEGAAQSFSAFRLPNGTAEGFLMHIAGADDHETHILLRIGKVLLGTTVEDVYEVMDPDAPGYKALETASPRWIADA